MQNDIPDLNNDSLEDLESSPEVSTTPQVNQPAPPVKKVGLATKLRGFISRLNIYLLLFLLLVIIAAIILFLVYDKSLKNQQQTIKTQELTQESVDRLIGSDAQIGDPKQLLTVESNSLLKGDVLIRGGLDVAGPIKVGGSINLPGITVSGQSSFDQVNINSLNIAGNTQINGSLNVQKGLSVSGPVNFSGSLSAANFSIKKLSVEQEISFSGHINSGGPTPQVSRGSALNSGTVTISGSDTSGTVSVNVGSSSGPGDLAKVTFKNSFSGTPHIVITPVTSQGSRIFANGRHLYISSRTSNYFTIAVSGSLPAGSINFDYIVVN